MAQKVGLVKVELEVFASNTAAIKFYEETGFVVKREVSKLVS